MDFDVDQDEFNRVVGLDYTLASKDNKWTGRSFVHQSILASKEKEAYSAGFRLNYNSRKHNFSYGGNRIGENYSSDLGFLRRTGIQKHFLRYGHRFWIDSKKIRSFELSQTFFYVDKPKTNNLVTDRSMRTRGELRFTNQSQLRFQFAHKYTYLINDFNPLGGDETPPRGLKSLIR